MFMRTYLNIINESNDSQDLSQIAERINSQFASFDQPSRDVDNYPGKFYNIVKDPNFGGMVARFRVAVVDGERSNNALNSVVHFKRAYNAAWALRDQGYTVTQAMPLAKSEWGDRASGGTNGWVYEFFISLPRNQSPSLEK